MRSRAVPYPHISIRDDAERLSGSDRPGGCFRDVSNHTGIPLDPAVIQGRFPAVFDKSSTIDVIPREAESEVSHRTVPFLLPGRSVPFLLHGAVPILAGSVSHAGKTMLL
jgi:hypothetical protein